MAEYKGSEGDVMRIREMQLRREKEKKLFAEQLKKMQKESETTLSPIEAKFSGKADNIEEQLKAETVGLWSLEQFRNKRITLESLDAEERKRLEQEKERL
jgi:hypothetical protein